MAPSRDAVICVEVAPLPLVKEIVAVVSPVRVIFGFDGAPGLGTAGFAAAIDAVTVGFPPQNIVAVTDAVTASAETKEPEIKVVVNSVPNETALELPPDNEPP